MKLTQKRINEGLKLAQEFGYWSEEVKNYLSQFPYNTAQKLSNQMILLEKGMN